ncbi:MAG: ogr/Delta-like zinc finger family protein [Thermodesulfobacteriota bacterium]
MTEDKTVCPHCGTKMRRFRSPEATTWGGGIWYVCYNDECQYYVRGWDFMFRTRGVRCSYRHRYNPDTGETGPMPVYSATMGLSCVLEEE